MPLSSCDIAVLLNISDYINNSWCILKSFPIKFDATRRRILGRPLDTDGLNSYGSHFRFEREIYDWTDASGGAKSGLHDGVSFNSILEHLRQSSSGNGGFTCICCQRGFVWLAGHQLVSLVSGLSVTSSVNFELSGMGMRNLRSVCSSAVITLWTLIWTLPKFDEMVMQPIARKGGSVHVRSNFVYVRCLVWQHHL